MFALSRVGLADLVSMCPDVVYTCIEMCGVGFLIGRLIDAIVMIMSVGLLDLMLNCHGNPC